MIHLVNETVQNFITAIKKLNYNNLQNNEQIMLYYDFKIIYNLNATKTYQTIIKTCF